MSTCECPKARLSAVAGAHLPQLEGVAQIFNLRYALWGLTLLFLSTLLSLQAAPPEFKAGVGRADITPTEPVHLAGYSGRQHPFTGVEQRIFVRALALQDGTGKLTLLLAGETIGTPRWFNDQLAKRLEQELKIPRERFLFASSHSHSTPLLKGNMADAFGMTGAAADAIERYSLYFLEQSVAAAREALTNLEPARLSFGRGKAHFAINRRQFGPDGVFLGYNPTGLVDEDVPVLRAEKTNGIIKAIVFTYACHGTTAGMNYDIGGDWPGYAQTDLERAFPGATALFIPGCAGDANPSLRGQPRYAPQHGLAMAGAVAAALAEPMRPLPGPIRAAFGLADLPLAPLPKKEVYEAKATNSVAAIARSGQYFLDAMARGEALPTRVPCPVQVLRFGHELTLVALGGEVVVDYSYRLRREVPDEPLWVAAYCNDVFAYVPSVRVLIEGGYETDISMDLYRLPTRFASEVENTLVRKVLELVKATRTAE